MPNVQTTLAGANFRPSEARDLVRQLQIGDELSLEPDPNNEYDDHAVKVLCNDVFIGFVAKADNRAIFEALIAGEDIPCEVLAYGDTNLKPLLEIELP